MAYYNKIATFYNEIGETSIEILESEDCVCKDIRIQIATKSFNKMTLQEFNELSNWIGDRVNFIHNNFNNV